jgi:hypothetical protein
MFTPDLQDGYVLDSTGTKTWHRIDASIGFVDVADDALREASAGKCAHVAVLDTNGDSWPDLYLVNTKHVKNRLFLGSQSGVFAEVTSGAATAQGAVVGPPRAGSVGMGMHAAVLDANGDSFPDLYVSNKGHGAGCCEDNQLFLGSAAGSFTTVIAGAAVNTQNIESRYTVVLDANGDERDDLYVCDFYTAAEPRSNRLFLGDGNGGFVPVTVGDAVSGLGLTFMAVAFDSNADDKVDLYVVNFDSLNQLFLGDGVGGFTTADESVAGDAVASGGKDAAAVVLDFNRDTYPDIYVTTDSNANQLFAGSANGIFTKVTEFCAATSGTVGTTPRGVLTLEANGDAWPDLFITNNNAAYDLFLGTEGGTFVRVTEGAIVTEIGEQKAAVVTTAGRLSLYLAHGGGNRLYQSDTQARFVEVVHGVLVDQQAMAMHTAVLNCNGDSWPDIFISKSINFQNELYLGTEDGSFLPTNSDAFMQTTGLYTSHAAVLDANDDTHSDLYVSVNGPSPAQNFLMLGTHECIIFCESFTT